MNPQIDMRRNGNEYWVSIHGQFGKNSILSIVDEGGQQLDGEDIFILHNADNTQKNLGLRDALRFLEQYGVNAKACKSYADLESAIQGRAATEIRMDTDPDRYRIKAFFIESRGHILQIWDSNNEMEEWEIDVSKDGTFFLEGKIALNKYSPGGFFERSYTVDFYTFKRRMDDYGLHGLKIGDSPDVLKEWASRNETERLSRYERRKSEFEAQHVVTADDPNATKILFHSQDNSWQVQHADACPDYAPSGQIHCFESSQTHQLPSGPYLIDKNKNGFLDENDLLIKESHDLPTEALQTFPGGHDVSGQSVELAMEYDKRRMDLSSTLNNIRQQTSRVDIKNAAQDAVSAIEEYQNFLKTNGMDAMHTDAEIHRKIKLSKQQARNARRDLRKD